MVMIIGILEIITMTLEAKATMLTMIAKQIAKAKPSRNNNGYNGNKNKKQKSGVIKVSMTIIVVTLKKQTT
jgi:hypothetical protein